MIVFALDELRMAVDLLVIELLRNGASRVFVDYDCSGDLTLYDPSSERSAA